MGRNVRPGKWGYQRIGRGGDARAYVVYDATTGLRVGVISRITAPLSMRSKWLPAAGWAGEWGEGLARTPSYWSRADACSWFDAVGPMPAEMIDSMIARWGGVKEVEW